MEPVPSRDFQFQHRHKEGHRMAISVTGNCIYNDQGEIIGFEGVLQDITAQKGWRKNCWPKKESSNKYSPLTSRSTRSANITSSLILSSRKPPLYWKRKSAFDAPGQGGQGAVLSGAKGLSEQVIKESHMRLGKWSPATWRSRVPRCWSKYRIRRAFPNARAGHIISRAFVHERSADFGEQTDRRYQRERPRQGQEF